MQHHDQTFVRATPTTVVARLPAHLSLDETEVDVDPLWDVGAPDGSCRTRASWRRGRRSGTGVVEVRPAGWGWSELALSGQGAAVPAQQLAAYVEDRPPVQLPVRRRGPVTRRAVLAAASAMALVGAAVVVLPFGASTAVTADTALSEFRAATPTSDAPRTGETPAPSASARPATTTEDAGGPDPASGVDPSAGPTTAPEAEPTAAAGPAERPSVDRAGADTSEAAPRQPAAPAPTPDRPAAGVYRYATDGWEELDVRGSHRRFPDETAQVIHHTDCGYRQIWEPLEERRDEHGFCVDTDPPALVTTATSRSFFGQRREQTFTCSPVTTTDGGWRTRCDDGDGTAMTVTTQQLGTGRRTVGGETVEVTELRVAADLTGDTSGQRRSTVWTRVGDGLLVRSEVEADLEAPGPFGRVRYRERYELDLLDLEPRT